MKTAAVIAEFNPFHNGHRYLAETVRRITGADYVIAVMSGSFVQRGAPAVLDKYTRTRFALDHGFDLILELPTVYALGHSDQFADGAVRILNALGCDYLCFGCEDDHLERLNGAAALFNEEPDDYWEVLMNALKDGLSYPAAREKAACICLPQRDPEAFSSDETVHELLNGSNNILAISYLQALHHTDSPMIPVPVRRIGNGHQEKLLPDEKHTPAPNPSGSPEPILLTDEIVPGTIRSGSTGQTMGKVPPRLYPSARSIRAVLEDSIETHRFLSAYPALRRSVSGSIYDTLQNARTAHAFEFEDDYSVMLRYRLLQMGKDDILSYCGQNESFANRLMHNRTGWQSITQLTERMKHKSRTHTGISRTLFRILLGIDDTAAVTAASETAYARVLGMRSDASGILREWKEADSLPVLLNLSEDTNILSDAQKTMLRQDLLAADLYTAVLELKTGEPQDNEYTRRFLSV